MIPERVGLRSRVSQSEDSARNQPLGNGTTRNIIENHVSNVQEAPLPPAFGKLSKKLGVVQEGLPSRGMVFREEALPLCCRSLSSMAGETLN